MRLLGVFALTQVWELNNLCEANVDLTLVAEVYRQYSLEGKKGIYWETREQSVTRTGRLGMLRIDWNPH